MGNGTRSLVQLPWKALPWKWWQLRTSSCRYLKSKSTAPTRQRISTIVLTMPPRLAVNWCSSKTSVLHKDANAATTEMEQGLHITNSCMKDELLIQIGLFTR
jgi:hypothetical protein